MTDSAGQTVILLRSRQGRTQHNIVKFDEGNIQQIKNLLIIEKAKRIKSWAPFQLLIRYDRILQRVSVGEFRTVIREYNGGRTACKRLLHPSLHRVVQKYQWRIMKRFDCGYMPGTIMNCETLP